MAALLRHALRRTVPEAARKPQLASSAYRHSTATSEYTSTTVATAPASVAAFDEAGEPQLHVSSWARMMLLLGYVASDEHVRRTRGSKPKAMDASTCCS